MQHIYTQNAMILCGAQPIISHCILTNDQYGICKDIFDIYKHFFQEYKFITNIYVYNQNLLFYVVKTWTLITSQKHMNTFNIFLILDGQ